MKPDCILNEEKSDDPGIDNNIYSLFIQVS